MSDEQRNPSWQRCSSRATAKKVVWEIHRKLLVHKTYSITYHYRYIHYYYVLLTLRVSFSMLTTILVSSHCTLWATSWWSSSSQERLLREGRKPSGGTNGNGRLERAPSPGWGLVWRSMNISGGNMLSAGSATSKWHKQIKFHEKLPYKYTFTEWK